MGTLADFVEPIDIRKTDNPVLDPVFAEAFVSISSGTVIAEQRWGIEGLLNAGINSFASGNDGKSVKMEPLFISSIEINAVDEPKPGQIKKLKRLEHNADETQINIDYIDSQGNEGNVSLVSGKFEEYSTKDGWKELPFNQLSEDCRGAITNNRDLLTELSGLAVESDRLLKEELNRGAKENPKLANTLAVVNEHTASLKKQPGHTTHAGGTHSASVGGAATGHAVGA